MIYDTVNLNQFERAFIECGRGEQFSKQGFKALFEYLDNCGVDVELDPISICCEFAELDDEDLLDSKGYYGLDDYKKDYSYFYDFLYDNYDVVKELSDNNYLIHNN